MHDSATWQVLRQFVNAAWAIALLRFLLIGATLESGTSPTGGVCAKPLVQGWRERGFIDRGTEYNVSLKCRFLPQPRLPRIIVPMDNLVVTPMTNQFAQRLSSVKPSASMAARMRVDALRAAGKAIVDFTIGEPDFPTPAHITASGVAALASGKTKYTTANGTPALRAAIVEKLRREGGLTYSSDEVAVGSGAKLLIYHALAATLDPGDEVIVPAPYWVSYPDMVSLQGGIPVVVSCDRTAGYKLSAAALEATITDRTRWLILNSPNNPTGAVYTRAELKSLADILRTRPKVRLLLDEIYEHFVYEGAEHHSMLAVAPDLKDRTLLVNGMSKSYAMTGWRLGYAAGPGSLIKAIVLLLSQSTSCATSISQEAAVTALQGSQDCVREAVDLFASRRDCMVRMLRAIPRIECSAPFGAFYAFPNVEGLIGGMTPTGTRLESDMDVVLYFLERAGVATIDGSSYGAANHLRLSFATPIDQIIAGCNALKEAVEACSFPSTHTAKHSHA